MRLPRALLALLAVLVVGACAAEEGVGAAEDAAVLECEPLQSIAMTASTAPANAGVLTAGIGWTDGGCELYADETHPDLVLVVADFEGALGLGLVAARADDWFIESSSLSSSPTTYVTGFEYGENVSMVLENGVLRLSLMFRVIPGTLTLIDLRPI